MIYSIYYKFNMIIESYFRASVTHVIVEANDQNIIPLSYDIMVALLRGKWILNSECKVIQKIIYTS